jgi:hypothetical protein
MKLKKREQEVIVAIKYAKQLRNERECPCPLSAKFGAFGYTHIGSTRIAITLHTNGQYS